jgi:signal transduction histidine kinase
MSSGHDIKKALNKTQYTLLLRFTLILLFCLLIVEMFIGALFFFELYRSEKKIFNSMALEYQRILTYDSADRLVHVLKANPYRLIDNNIAAYSIRNNMTDSPHFIAGDGNLPLKINAANYTVENKYWIRSFLINPYMSLKIKGKTQDFWLVLDNHARHAIAYKQWLMTLYALIALVCITTLFTHLIIRRAMLPLATLDDLLNKLGKGELDMANTAKVDLEGLSIVSASVYGAIAKLHHVTTTLNMTVDAIAHDIRTPLSRITLAAQSTLLGKKDLQQMQNALSDCAEYSVQANNMLTALMKLNDELIGKRQEKTVPTNVGQVMKTVMNWYEDVADEKAIDLSVQADMSVFIQSDPDKLTQVLVNLVDNAIKYTEPKGKIALKLIVLGDNHVEISVEDNGIGIDYQYQDLIFERLYRVDSSRSNVEGYGLGLSLAKAMTNNLGGKIKFNSKPNIGSTFTVTLGEQKSNAIDST